MNWKTFELPSDHIAIILDLQPGTNRYPLLKPHRTINLPKFETVQINPHTESKERIDMTIQMLTSAITNAIDLNSTGFTQTDNKHDLLRNIYLEIEFKRRLCTRWQRTIDSTIKTAFNKQFSIVKNLLHAPIRFRKTSEEHAGKPRKNPTRF